MMTYASFTTSYLFYGTRIFPVPPPLSAPHSSLSSSVRKVLLQFNSSWESSSPGALARLTPFSPSSTDIEYWRGQDFCLAFRVATRKTMRCGSWKWSTVQEVADGISSLRIRNTLILCTVFLSAPKPSPPPPPVVSKRNWRAERDLMHCCTYVDRETACIA